MAEPTEPTPAQRHWLHVEAIRQLYEAMPEGFGKDRMKARWEQLLEEHRTLPNQGLSSDS